MTAPSLFADCIVPGCHVPAGQHEPCGDHQRAAKELFEWAWPNGLPRTLSPAEVAARRAERERAVAVLLASRRRTSGGAS